MPFIKNIFIYAIIAAVAFGLKMGLTILTTHLEEKSNKKYMKLGETPSGTLFLLFIVGYFTLIVTSALVATPVLFIISGWSKVFSVILTLVVFSAILYSLYGIYAVYIQKANLYKKAKAPIIWSAIINQVISNIFIVLSTSALEISFNISDNVVSYIHDITWTIVFIINIVIVVKACKTNSQMLKEEIYKSEQNYTEG